MDSEIYFYKGEQNTIEGKTEEEGLIELKETFSKILDGKNLSFLLGCGTSSHRVKTGEVGIPTMQPLAQEFYSDVLSEDEVEFLQGRLLIDVTKERFSKNIEILLGTLHSLYFYYESTERTDEEDAEQVAEIIKKTRNFLIEKCLNEKRSKKGTDKPLIDIYKSFYRKLLFRNSNLPKLNIFTTNYDLYSEISLDKLGIHYVNGFSGGIKKYFNPTIFNYAMAEKMDLSQTKWSVIDNFIYLYKLHGSLNWVQANDETKLFNVREIQECTLDILSKEDVVMIHPTPLKYNASLGSPYSDLFREFQRKLMQTNNVLIVLGYSFSDEHINNLIYQAFTIPSFRLIVFGDVDANEKFAHLLSLNDPRIWIIGGKLASTKSLHYFKEFVEHVLPELSNDDMDKKMEKTFREFFMKHSE